MFSRNFRRRLFRPRLEALEGRDLLSAYTLTLLDGLGGPCLNDAGAAAGTVWYGTTSQGYSQGYLRSNQGNITLFSPPGSNSVGNAVLNNAGTVAGSFYSYPDGSFPKR